MHKFFEKFKTLILIITRSTFSLSFSLETENVVHFREFKSLGLRMALSSSQFEFQSSLLWNLETSYDNLANKKQKKQINSIISGRIGRARERKLFRAEGKRLFTEKICIRWQKFALFIFFNIFKCFYFSRISFWIAKRELPLSG